MTLTVKVGFWFSGTDTWSASMLTRTRSPPVPGVPGSSVTVVLTSVLSRVSFSNFHTSAPLTESIALTTDGLAPM
ncbi:hypothetical protein D3C80_1435350 [compost metagenome]